MSVPAHISVRLRPSERDTLAPVDVDAAVDPETREDLARVLGTRKYATYTPDPDRAWSDKTTKDRAGQRKLTVTHDEYPYALLEDGRVAAPRPRDGETTEAYRASLAAFLPDEVLGRRSAAYAPVAKAVGDRDRRSAGSARRAADALVSLSRPRPPYVPREDARLLLDLGGR